ncbi:hypothetical protein P7C71_g3124, partial [Lecanoromycetidae sp. Uapishka_2]
MIKSWNSENVEIAQRDVSDLSSEPIHAHRYIMHATDPYLTLPIDTGPLNLAQNTPYRLDRLTLKRQCTWATQEKNLALLTSAYHTSRNVLLFFSVNNSRAFQGYARMTSA